MYMGMAHSILIEKDELQMYAFLSRLFCRFMMTLEWSMCSVSLLLLVAVSKVRLECSDGQLFLTNCNSVQRLSKLLFTMSG